MSLAKLQVFASHFYDVAQTRKILKYGVFVPSKSKRYPGENQFVILL